MNDDVDLIVVSIADSERVQPVCVSERVKLAGRERVLHTVYYGPSAFVTEEPVVMEEPEASKRLFEDLLRDAQRDDLPGYYEFLLKGFEFVGRNASDPDLRKRAAACHADVSARAAAAEFEHQERVSQIELRLAAEKAQKSKWYAFWRRWE